MNFVTAVISLISLAARRIWHQRLLMACLLAGLIAAVGLLAAVPLYADAVQNRLLQGELTEAGTRRPPFAFLWRYVGVWNGDISWAAYQPINSYLTEQATNAIDLPLDDSAHGEQGRTMRHVATARLRLFPGAEASFNQNEPLLWTNLGFITDLAAQINLVEGAFPVETAASTAIEVIVSEETAVQLGLQVGETYTLFGGDTTQLPVRIVGVWQPRDPANTFWFYEPDAFAEMLLTSEGQFTQQVVPVLPEAVSTAVWYQLYDGGRIRPATVAAFLQNVRIVEARATALLDGTTLDVSPVSALQSYGRSNNLLTLTLTIFSIPLIGILLYFISLIANMVVARGASEIAIWRSRGATRGQVVGVYLLEGLLVGGLGFAGGLWLALQIARLMGRTRTFLDPAILAPSTGSGAGVGELTPVLSGTAVAYALLGVGLALLALLIPALLAAAHTIVTLRWQQARALLAPLWQRAFLDVLLLIPPFYGWYQLEQQGNISLLGGGSDPFANPLLFLVPILFCFSLALVALRLFPLLLGGLAWLAEKLPGTTLLLTLRQLARATAQYTGPLLLLTLTLSLASFTASMAVTFDDHLADQIYYQVGADLNLAELGQAVEENSQQPGAAAQPSEDEPRWLFLPVTDHLLVDGVRAAARVGEHTAVSSIGGRQQSGHILGVDRLDFAQVAFYRPDFAANEALGGLMNRLAVQRDHILVSRDFLARNNLQVGDPLRLTIGAAGDFADAEFTIAAPLDLFPTQYPQDGPFFVANLDHLHEALGGAYPYNVWLQTDPAVPSSEIVSGVRQLGFAVITAQDVRERILQEQTRPERQGLFGLLSVGFLAAAVLTVLGFLVYAVVSFHQRTIQLGMLRAIGLSVGQMAAYLAGEQAVLITAGVGLGTGLGVWASHLFIPFLQVGEGVTAVTPPFIVQIAWEQLGTIYALFAAMFVIAVLVLIALVARMRIFEAVKLGEAV